MVYIYIYMYTYIYMYVYVCIYIYICMCMYIYIYIYILYIMCIYACITLRDPRAPPGGRLRSALLSMANHTMNATIHLKYAKAFDDRAQAPSVRNAYLSTQRPVVICPCLCTPEFITIIMLIDIILLLLIIIIIILIITITIIIV